MVIFHNLKMPKIILGTGISGLSAAHYLLKKYPNKPVQLLEESRTVGGWIKSRKQADGTIFEQGPRTIRPRGEAGANTLQIIEEIGLSSKVMPISSTHPAALNRMVYAQKELHTLPSDIFSIFKTQKPFSKPLISYIFKELFIPSQKIENNDESIYDFVHRRFGGEISDYLISPMICGICGGNAKEISVKLLMESLYEKEQKYGSVLKGIVLSTLEGNNVKLQEKSFLQKRAKDEKWSIYSFHGGLAELPKTMLSNIIDHGGKVDFLSKCSNITFRNNRAHLTLTNGRKLSTDHLISSISSQNLAILIENQHPQLAALLNKIPMVSLAVVNLKFDKKLIEKLGFGFLVSPLENLPILGVIYDSCCFPKGDNTVLTAMLGGHWFIQHFGENPTEKMLLKTALEQIENILGITAKPVDYRVNILKNCIPQYKIGHKDNVHKICEYISSHDLPLSICGSSYNGIGVNDVILSAKNVVDQL